MPSVLNRSASMLRRRRSRASRGQCLTQALGGVPGATSTESGALAKGGCDRGTLLRLVDDLRAEARACLACPRLPLEFWVLYTVTLVSPLAGVIAWRVHDEVAVGLHRVGWWLGPFGRKLVGAGAIFVAVEVVARMVRL